MHREEGALDKFYNANVNLATGLQAVEFVYTWRSRGVQQGSICVRLMVLGLRGLSISGSSEPWMLGPAYGMLFQYAREALRRLGLG